MSPTLHRHWAPVPFSPFSQPFFPGHCEGCSIKIPVRTGLKWLLLLADLYTNATGCRLLLRKMEFFKNISKADKKHNWGVKCWQFGHWVVRLDLLVQTYALHTVLGIAKGCMPLVTLCQTTELLPLFSFFFFFHSSKVSPVVRGRGEWGQAEWNEIHESLIDHREVPLNGCQRLNISYGEEDHRAGSDWKEIGHMRRGMSQPWPWNWAVSLLAP